MARKAKKSAGNPVDVPGGGSAFDRVSPPITAGHAAASTGDHGAAQGSRDPMDVAGPKRLALGHPDMQFGTTNVMPLLSAVVSGSSSEHAPEHNIVGLYADARVAMSRLDAASASRVSGPSGNPHMHGTDRQSRGSATPPNGTHSLASPQSNAVAMKSSEAREALKRHLFPGSGAR